MEHLRVPGISGRGHKRESDRNDDDDDDEHIRYHRPIQLLRPPGL